MTTFGDLLAQARTAGLDEFVRAHPDAVLLIESEEKSSGGELLDTERVSEPGARPGPEPAPAEPRLELLRKRSGSNAFMSMVTIGRAANNDVVLDARGVSKFHAYVLREPGGGCTLVDAGSSYGTLVNDRSVKPREEKVPLRGGERLTIGSVRCVFHLPSTLHHALRHLRRP